MRNYNDDDMSRLAFWIAVGGIVLILLGMYYGKGTNNVDRTDRETRREMVPGGHVQNAGRGPATTRPAE